MADAVEECKALAERLGAPVVNSYLHNDSFPASHPLWCGPLGYQGSKAAMKLIAQADVVIALGSRLGPLRHAAAARHGLLAQERQDHPDRCRPQDARPGEEDLRRHLRRRQGRRRRAHRAPRPARTLACDATAAERAGQIAAEKAAWEKELDEWTHEQDPYSLDMIEEQKQSAPPAAAIPASAPGAARARKGHAGGRDGVHRHRQHQLGGQQLPALRAAAQLLRRR